MNNKSYSIAAVLKADEKIGTGHLMRVKSILRELDECSFTLLSDSVSDRLLPLCSEFDSVSIYSDYREIAAAIRSHKPDLVIVDHYFLDEDFEKLIYPFTKVVVIDDLVNRKHICHMLFDAWVLRSADEYRDLVPNECILCVGSDYNYVKPEFSSVKKQQSADGRIRILVNFGGSDPAHACLATAQSVLSGKLYEKYSFLFISGLSNPDHEKIKELLDGINNIQILRHCDDMPHLFGRIDYAIGAAGGMQNERNIASIPTCVVEIADNQKGVADFINEYSLGQTLKLEELNDCQKILHAIELLDKNRDTYIRNCAKLYRKNGIFNVVEKIKTLLER
ncbi:MAG: UDP-2,4-diacetamido-2,4,6-trideoxy-beta-L-altropyranose hydrolase [Succinivibrio sp.]